MTARILLTALLLTSTTTFGQTSTKPSNPTTSAKKTGPKLYDITVEQLRCPKAVATVPKTPFVAPCQLKTLPPWQEGWVHFSKPGKRMTKWKWLLQQCMRATHPQLSTCEALVSHQGRQPKLLKTRRRTQRRLDHIKVTRGGPRIRPGKIVYKGSLSRETIQRTVKGSLSSIRRCYEAELQKQPGLRGKLVVAWTIGPLGRVTAASASQNTVGSVDVERCVVRVVRAMEFVPPKNGRDVVVHYPFVFDVSMFARDIDDEVRRWDKQTSACWKHAPTKKAADVDLYWTLKNDGSVSSVRRTKAGNLKVSACLADVVRNMKFGAVPAAEGIEVAYTFQRRGSLSR